MIEKRGRKISNRGGPGAGKQGPFQIRLPVYGGNGCGAGEIEENEQEVAEGCRPAAEQGGHETKSGLVHFHLLGGAVKVADIAQ